MRIFNRLRVHSRLASLMLCMIAVILPCSLSAESYQGLFDVYASNREQGIPNHITSDLLLLSYSMIRQRSIEQTEEQQLVPLFQELLSGLEVDLQADVEQDATSKANRDFVSLLQALLKGEGDELDCQSGQVEFQRVQQASAAMASEMWGQVIDYTQFKPRGRYNRTLEMRNFFRAFRYAGVVLFAAKPSKATGVSPELAARMSAQALLFVELIDNNPRLSETYQRINALLGWQFGPAEDLSNADLRAAVANKAIKTDAELAGSFFEYAKKHDRQPQILSAPVDGARLEQGVSARDVLTGWRLLPQRYSADSAVFQRLVYNGTGEFQADEKACPTPFSLAIINGRPVKGFPRGIELMALLGSRMAESKVRDACEDRFDGYAEALEESRKLLDSATGTNHDFLTVIRSGFTDHEDMALNERRLETLLAFWTWQRYLNVLYQKQSYTVSGKGLSLAKGRAGASLEPASALYRTLFSLVEVHRKKTPAPSWDTFGKLLERVIKLSARLEQGESLSGDDQAFLNDLDRSLLALTGAHDKPIVIDVHTNPAAGQVVEQATGYPRVVTGADKSRGAVFTHREFKQPMHGRLSDESWRKMLREESLSKESH